MNLQEIGFEALTAAQELRCKPRSCISRAYYAAYTILVHALKESKGVKFAPGREGPSHKDLPKLVENHLANTRNRAKMKELKAAIRRLYKARIDADYRFSLLINEDVVRRLLRDVCWIWRELEERP